MIASTLLGVAGVAKLAYPADTTAVFGVDSSWRVALGLLDLTIAGGLLSRVGRGWAAPLGLLVLFGGAVYSMVLRPLGAPACGCFGQLGSTWPGVQVAVSGVGILALAGVVFAIQPGRGSAAEETPHE